MMDPETLNLVLAGRLLDVHTALPGIVKSYDSDAQTVDVQPALQRVIAAVDENSEDRSESLPILSAVPVMWPRSGGFFLHFPILAGDSVLLIFPEVDAGAWRVAGTESDPGTPERHGLSGAMAIPGAFPRRLANTAASGEYGRIGSETGPYVEFRPDEIHAGGTEALALASGLTAIRDAIQGASTTPNDGGAALKAAILLALSADLDWVNRATTVLKGS